MDVSSMQPCEPMDIKVDDVNSLGFRQDSSRLDATADVKSEATFNSTGFGVSDIIKSATANGLDSSAAAAEKWPKEEVCDDLSYEELKWLYKNLDNKDSNQEWKILNEKLQISAANGCGVLKEEANHAISEMKQRLLGSTAYEEKLRELRSFSVTVALPDGNSVSVTIRPFERVLSLKQHIEHKTGFKVEQQRLFDRRNELQDHDTFEGRLVVSGALFTLLLREKGFEIFVQGMATKLYLLRDLTPQTTVPELKKKIQERENIAPCSQVLKFGTRNLENDKTIGSYGLRQGSTISVTGRLHGGAF